jgi:hypothetical protein
VRYLNRDETKYSTHQIIATEQSQLIPLNEGPDQKISLLAALPD